ncbi:hypothetical protein TVAG_230830 [Trichomonas vaginalis G3]|uniref:Uncharacterized protein n=1 Tax=Trichomonas vaginalis (strain ATCC PRA-98 / G3) TaxID=412133 RepID=A2EE11_TRIV3|nr:hypothetical protein TVAGG3_0889970 [Trichomonas vaginalis G3]EAY09123.1 hypothetical protein TVAG_230830 [Trichomonas vaginalis G3]KAI5502645.1 hypothetical protein TVAGG3_0889970 [Trichomonas vaginalis G3]|eukprot:XP_001321346.1 hypothetical protein [Trichomonas vaginalis G3]
MSDADSSADAEPPCSGSTTANKSIIEKTGLITAGETHYGCLRFHPMHFHSEVQRPKAPFNPRVFDWTISNMNFPRLVMENDQFPQYCPNYS